MSNYYALCFYRIDFFVIPSYIELPWIYQRLVTVAVSFNGIAAYSFDCESLHICESLISQAIQVAVRHTAVT